MGTWRGKPMCDGLMAASVCQVLQVDVSAGDTAQGGASGHMLVSAANIQTTFLFNWVNDEPYRFCAHIFPLLAFLSKIICKELHVNREEE